MISDLENSTTYYFQVTAVSGDWSGTPSAVLSATPLPATVPGAPSNLAVEPADGALRLTWGKTKDATYYQVFYRGRARTSSRPGAAIHRHSGRSDHRPDQRHRL